MNRNSKLETRLALLLTLLVVPVPLLADEDLAARLRQLDATVIPADSPEGKALPKQIRENQQKRLWQAAARENEAWNRVRTREDWEAFRNPRIEALRKSLGNEQPLPSDLQVQVTGQLSGPGYRIENLIYQSRPGLVVTANLYLPEKPPDSMPGIILVHSHHNPRTQGELQDMGMTWARLGCAVLVMDQLGHGERRQHPFTDASKYKGSFKPGRQDYYFRYNVAQQLYLIGESLMGWMVHDIRCGVSLLLSRPGVDLKRLALFGSVAGGGDPAGVTAALDPRITLVAPFNFGGVQPDYSVPENPELRFYWFSLGYWESTRCLRLGAQGGFAHWVIIGSVAPRQLLYCHEFAWDGKKDPAWARLQKIFQLYKAEDNLAFAAGKGELKGKPPESTHCNNIGAYHRSQMYPTLKRWLDLPIPEKEFTERHKTEELLALTPAVVKKVNPRPLHELAREEGRRRALVAGWELSRRPLPEQRQWLREKWSQLLALPENHTAQVTVRGREIKPGMVVERLVIGTAPDIDPVKLTKVQAPGIVVPTVLLLPARAHRGKLPVVVALAQEGRQRFLKERAGAIAELLEGGVAVCLPDLRGMGESHPGGGRGRGSTGTSLSATEQILGGTLLGARLHDLRTVLAWLRGRADVDGAKIALWGDSFAPVNPPERNLAVPLDADPFPPSAEPGGGLLAMLGALFDDDIRAVHVHGSLAGYAALLDSQFFYVPHDVIVPGALTAGDLSLLLSALRPRPLRLQSLVDGQNRRLTKEQVEGSLLLVRQEYQRAGAADRLVLEADADGNAAGAWLLRQLKEK